MKIPKGTAKAIYLETNQMFFKNIWIWLKISCPWWLWACLMDFGYIENSWVIDQMNYFLGPAFVIADFIFTVSLFLMLVLSFVAMVLAFQAVDRGEKIPSVLRLYQLAYRMLWSLVIVKFLYVWRIFLKTLLLIFPGVLALTDGFSHGFSLLIDGKNGKDAIMHSEKIVRVNRVRYWDYLLIGFSIPCLIAVPYMIFIDQWAYFFRLKDLYYINVAVEGTKYVAMYFAALYWWIFHYRIYQKFKTFLSTT